MAAAAGGGERRERRAAAVRRCWACVVSGYGAVPSPFALCARRWRWAGGLRARRRAGVGGGGKGAPGTPGREEKGAGLGNGVSPRGAEACWGAEGVCPTWSRPGEGSWAAGGQAGRLGLWAAPGVGQGRGLSGSPSVGGVLTGGVSQAPGAAALLLGPAAAVGTVLKDRAVAGRVAGRLCCSAAPVLAAGSQPWCGVTGVSFPHRLQEDAQSLFDKTGMEKSNGNLPIHRDTILPEVCVDRVTITNL